MSWIAVGIGAAALLGGAATYMKAGDKPGVPDYPKLDLDMLQKLAISGNMEAFPEAQKLASMVNAGNRSEVLKARNEAVPGAIGQIQKNIMDDLSGVADVTDTKSAISNATSANFNLGAGGASQFSKFAVVGKLGRSVAQRKQQGLQNFMNLVPVLEAPRFDPSSMFLSPELRVKNAQIESAKLFDIEMARAAIKAQPSKTQQAVGSMLGIAGQGIGMWAGGQMGGGGGGMLGGMMGGGGGGGGGSGGYAYPSGFGASPSNTGSTEIPGRFNFPGSGYNEARPWYR